MTPVGHPSLGPEQNEIVIIRPVGHRACHAKASGCEFLDHNILRDPMPAAVCGDSFDGLETRARRKLDDGDASAGF